MYSKNYKVYSDNIHKIMKYGKKIKLCRMTDQIVVAPSKDEKTATEESTGKKHR